MLMALFSAGCFGTAHKTVIPREKAAVHAPETLAVEVLREDLWIAGGSLVFIPFSPGVNAEAGPAVDHLALMIVKGTSDVFQERPGVFSLITDGDADSARFMIEGRIEEFDRGGSFKAIGIGKRAVTLKIKAELRERSTGQVLALITGFKAFKNLKEADAEAYSIGRAIGEKVQH